MINKIVSIELPTCNKLNFEKYILSSLSLISPLSKYAKWNINFQKEYTQEDIERYLPEFHKYGFDIDYEFHEYNNPPGFNSIVRFREDTHQIDPVHPFSFSLDDDIEIINSNYCKDVLACLYHILTNDNVGGECIEGKSYYYRNPGKRLFLLEKCSFNHDFRTDGGILIRNTNNLLFDEECGNLLGRGQDALLSKLVIRKGFILCRTVTDSYMHYELRNGDKKNSGFYHHEWYRTTDVNNKNSVQWYLNNKFSSIEPDYNKLTIDNFDYSKMSMEELIKNIDKEVDKSYE